MSSIVWPSLLRQTGLAAASKRAFSTNISTNFPATLRKTLPSILSRPVTRCAFAKDNVGSFRIAAFHASSRKDILPPAPQAIDGTANDPAPVPAPNPSHGSYHWTFERLISAALIPLTIAPFASGSLNPATDAILCGAILIHSHIGFQSCVIDYIPTKRLPKTRKVAWWILRGATLTVAVALYEFETNDVGLTEAIKRIWKA